MGKSSITGCQSVASEFSPWSSTTTGPEVRVSMRTASSYSAACFPDHSA